MQNRSVATIPIGVKMVKEWIRPDNVSLPEKEGKKDRFFELCEGKLGGQVSRPAPLKVEFRKMLIPMPLLFLSGVFTGVGIMLALN